MTQSMLWAQCIHAFVAGKQIITSAFMICRKSDAFVPGPRETRPRFSHRQLRRAEAAMLTTDCLLRTMSDVYRMNRLLERLK